MIAVAALVAGQRTTGLELEDAADDRVEEGAVVRDDDDRPGEAAQPVLQPLQAVAVEVVGRLVEQQHRRRRPAACRPAARAPARRPTAAPAACRRRGGRWPARGAPRRATASSAQPPSASKRSCALAVALERGGRRVARGQPRQQRAQLAAHGPQLAQPGAEQLAERRARRRAPPAAASRCARPAPVATAPRSGRSTPASSRSSVDLPTPLGPTSPARSPSPSTNERPSKSGAPSYAFVRSDACNMESSCVVREAGGLGRGKRDGHRCRRARTPGRPSAPPHARAREVVPRRPEIVCGGCLLHRGAA